jgi:DDE superfamily endonuclease
MPPWTGRCRCSRRTWSSASVSGCATTRSGGNSSAGVTCGSGPATSWTRTPSWRKKRRIRRQIRRLRPRTALLAEDETELLLFPPLRAGWSPRGQPKEVLLSGRNARRVVFGALNLRTGSRFLLAREHQRAVDYQAFLRLLHDRYRGWHLALLQDEDPSHTAAGSVELAGEFEIELLWLPKRSPKLNPMDTLWGQGKDVVSANKQYATIDEQVERLIDHLESLSVWETFQTTGLLSKKFWLRSVL